MKVVCLVRDIHYITYDVIISAISHVLAPLLPSDEILKGVQNYDHFWRNEPISAKTRQGSSLPSLPSSIPSSPTSLPSSPPTFLPSYLPPLTISLSTFTPAFPPYLLPPLPLSPLPTFHHPFLPPLPHPRWSKDAASSTNRQNSLWSRRPTCFHGQPIYIFRTIFFFSSPSVQAQR